ncbi:3-oxo-5a-steroid 4- dehydrogenase [Dimargaris xerosporica]|nr:3-oxo-5a-steroid 4- dehydrogenase [Dimargaris xerosporica]
MQITVEKRRRPPAEAAPAHNRPNSAGPFPLVLDVEADTTVQTVKALVAQAVPKLSPTRQRLTYDGTPLLDDQSKLDDLKIGEGAVLRVKDLGPQIGWRTTFICEYLGPFLANPLFYFGSRYVYGQAVQHSTMQTVALAMFEAHFLKRLYETVYVHRFSNGTMPFANLIKNTAYYTLIAGVNVGYWVYGPWAAAPAQRSPLFTAFCLGLFLFAELSNYITHINLRNLRPPGTRVRRVPRGYGFDLVSCPNYFFEVLGWVAFTLYTQSLASLAFTVVGATQMYIWAVKKHRNYRREFSDYPRSRTAMFPFVA